MNWFKKLLAPKIGRAQHEPSNKRQSLSCSPGLSFKTKVTMLGLNEKLVLDPDIEVLIKGRG